MTSTGRLGYYEPAKNNELARLHLSSPVTRNILSLLQFFMERDTSISLCVKKLIFAVRRAERCFCIEINAKREEDSQSRIKSAKSSVMSGEWDV